MNESGCKSSGVSINTIKRCLLRLKETHFLGFSLKQRAGITESAVHYSLYRSHFPVVCVASSACVDRLNHRLVLAANASQKRLTSYRSSNVGLLGQKKKKSYSTMLRLSL